MLFVRFTECARATALAANHLLMQFASVSGFALDGFAFTAESRVGNAIGAGWKAAIIAFVASNERVRTPAERLLPLSPSFPLSSRPGRPLIATDLALRPFGESGIWWALMASYLYRAGALGLYLPGLLRTIEVAEPASAT